MAQEGDTTVMNAIRDVGRTLGLAIANLVTMLNPARIVLGGSLSEAGFELLNGVREVVYSRSFPLATQSLRVVTSKSGPYAASLGASATAIEHYLSEGLGELGLDGKPEADLRPMAAAAMGG